MEEKSLKEKTARGLWWGFLNNGAMQLFNAIFGIVLAKLLSDSDYGLAGEVAIFSAIAAALQESGFVSALTNRKNPTHLDYNSVFWFNITVGFVLYVILWFCAPLIVRFFDDPELLWLSRYAFVGFFLASFSITPRAILFRQMKVKEQTIISITALVVSGCVGVTMAVCKMGYWCVPTQGIVFVTLISVLSWRVSGWRPSLQVSLQPIRQMFGFSCKMLITNVFNCINNSIFAFAFGHFYNKHTVGIYTQADKWNKMGSQLITGMVQGVAQPMFVQVGDERERLRRVFRKMTRFTAFISFPAMFGLSLVAPEFITVIIDPKWLPSAQLMQLLCIAGAFMPITSLYFNFLISRGRSDVYMWNTLSQGIIVLLLLISIRQWGWCIHLHTSFLSLQLSGIRLMVISYVVVYILWLLLWHWFVRREIGLSFFSSLLDLLPFAGVAILTMLFTWWVTNVLQLADVGLWLLLIVRILFAAALYLGLMWILKAEVMRESFSYIKSKTHHQ